MKILTSELTGMLLNWAVAKCDGYTDFEFFPTTGSITSRQKNGLTVTHEYSTNLAQGGLLIEREKFDSINYVNGMQAFCANLNGVHAYGPTLLTAITRCFVVSRHGSEIDIPDDVISQSQANIQFSCESS
jgi:hypothetical protein